MSKDATDTDSARAIEFDALEADCPFPSTHDKLGEAHYFVHEMVAKYHKVDPFRFSLSAFLQAARSVTFHLQGEAAKYDKVKEWYERVQQPLLKADADLKALNELRVQTVHKSALVVGSKAMVGAYRYGQLRTGLPVPMKADIDGFWGLITARMLMEEFPLAHPQRAWAGEEIGIEREWILSDLSNREIVSVCIQNLEKLRRVVWDAHEAFYEGQTPFPVEGCEHASTHFTSLRESEMFPEVARCWNGDVPEVIRPRDGDLKLLAGPSPAAPVWHVVRSGTTARGWVGPPSPHWDHHYLSAILDNIDGVDVNRKTAVFFEAKGAAIEPGPTDSTPEPEAG